MAPNQFTSGIVKVKARTGCPYGAWSDSLEIKVKRVFPDFNVKVSTGTKLYYGKQYNITLSVPFWSFVKYNWTVPNGWKILSGQGSNEILVETDKCSAGIVKVSMEVNGHAEIRTSKSVKFVRAVDKYPIVQGDNYLCNIGERKIYTVKNLSSYYSSVNWTVSDGLSIVSGQGTPTIEVELVSNTRSVATLSTTVNIGGCLNTDASKTIALGAPVAMKIWPDEPFAIQNRPIGAKADVFGAGDVYCRWSVGGGKIVSGQGIDYVHVLANNNCQRSLYFRVEPSNQCGVGQATSIEIPFQCTGLNVYPSPAQKTITIDLQTTQSSVQAFTVQQNSTSYSLAIIDRASGDVIMRKRFSGKKVSLDVSSLKPGLYLVVVRDIATGAVRQQIFVKQ